MKRVILKIVFSENYIVLQISDEISVTAVLCFKWIVYGNEFLYDIIIT